MSEQRPHIEHDLEAVVRALDEQQRAAFQRVLVHATDDGERRAKSNNLLDPQAEPQPTARKPRQPAPQERCGVGHAAAILGLSSRKIQDMASRGEIPGAAKLARVWTFDIEKLRRHVRLKERQEWQSGRRLPDAIGAAMPCGGGPRSMEANTGGRFTQVIQRLRGQGARRGRIG